METKTDFSASKSNNHVSKLCKSSSCTLVAFSVCRYFTRRIIYPPSRVGGYQWRGHHFLTRIRYFGSIGTADWKFNVRCLRAQTIVKGNHVINVLLLRRPTFISRHLLVFRQQFLSRNNQAHWWNLAWTFIEKKKTLLINA